jgi:hypothetical protein
MKALSIKQPFADMIVRGLKTIETRTWKTEYRGDILICSSKKPHEGSYLHNNEIIPCRNYLLNNFVVFGKAVCVARLVECRPMLETDQNAACCEYYKAWSWVLDNIRPVATFPVKGSLNLFEVDDNQIKFL